MGIEKNMECGGSWRVGGGQFKALVVSSLENKRVAIARDRTRDTLEFRGQ